VRGCDAPFRGLYFVNLSSGDLVLLVGWNGDIVFGGDYVFLRSLDVDVLDSLGIAVFPFNPWCFAKYDEETGKRTLAINLATIPLNTYCSYAGFLGGFRVRSFVDIPIDVVDYSHVGFDEK